MQSGGSNDQALTIHTFEYNLSQSIHFILVYTSIQLLRLRFVSTAHYFRRDKYQLKYIVIQLMDSLQLNSYLVKSHLLRYPANFFFSCISSKKY